MWLLQIVMAFFFFFRPQWLSELRQMWMSIHWWIVCVLIFLIGSNTMLQSMVSPLWLHWVKDVCMLRCNLPHALLPKWLESFTCHCSNMGVKRTMKIKIRTAIQFWRRTFSHCYSQVINSQPSNHQSVALATELPPTLNARRRTWQNGHSPQRSFPSGCADGP